MKFNNNVLSLVALAAVPSMVVAAPTATCDEQSSCVQFSMKKLNTDQCGVGGDCTVEVCMLVSGGLGGCGKGAGGTFSHMCMQSDSQGCPLWMNDDDVTPKLGYGSSTSCSLSGENDGAAYTGKCSGANDVLMCQEGAPGETLYWILKDGNDRSGSTEDRTYAMTANGCDSQEVRCFNGIHACGGTQAQKLKERTWAFTIPDGTGTCPSICPGPTPPGPNPPGPNPPGPTPVVPQPTPVSPPTDDNTPTPPSPTPPSPTPGSNGDPHFKTWANEHFEYHGQCDLLLAKDENFADGLGLDIQIRTKLVRFWSYIRSAAIRIGHDIIELEGSSDPQDESIHYWYNMQYQSDEAKTMAGFPVTIRKISQKYRFSKVVIDLDSKYPGVKIVMTTFKEFVKVEVEGATEEAFGKTVGMLGDFKSGKTLARDGKTSIDDFVDYGREWQVTPNEDMIFHSTEEPQFPAKCLEPEDPRGDRRRRLAESNITMEQAESACSRLKDPMDRKDCIYDILATQDLEMSGAF